MDRPDYILGIAILGHELSLTLVDGAGDVVFIAEEERYSRQKRGQFVFHPDLAVRILAECGVGPEAVGTLAVAGDPCSWVSDQQQLLSFSAPARARHLNAWIDAFRQTFPRLRSTVRVRHHRAHAASAFFASPWNHAAVVTFDGFGDGEVATISEGRDASMKLLESQPFPHSLPYMYHAFARWLGLDGPEREGKLMALAAYGLPLEEEGLRRLLSSSDRGPWRCAPEFLNVECKSGAWAQTLEKLLGPGRRSDEPLTDRHFNAAASMQALLESELLAVFRRAKALTGGANVCCAGGAFLNCKANGKLQESGIFKTYFFQPLAADCGLSLGAALQAARELGRRPWRMRQIRLGSDLDLDNLPAVARLAGVRFARSPDVAEAAARRLAGGSIIGWCQGRMEVGPRSLCGRSLLADPRFAEMRDRVNQIKLREAWRPFAPVMLEEETPALFGKSIASPHMNVAFRVVRPEVIPAAVHVDGTARLQTVRQTDDPLVHRLLNRFREITGVGALLNTSLNLRGQPIARTVQDCVTFLCESEIDVLFIGDFIVERPSETRPVKLGPSPEWKGLPSEFLLVAIDPDGSLRPCVNELVERANGLIELTVNGSFEICESDHVLERIEGRNVVLLLPGYLEVWKETLPRALAWAGRNSAFCAGLWLADLTGKVVPSDDVLRTLDGTSLMTEPLSDVEIHYLRSVARKRQMATSVPRVRPLRPQSEV